MRKTKALIIKTFFILAIAFVTFSSRGAISSAASKGLFIVSYSETTYGFCDVTGKIIVPLSYNECRDFFDGLAAVKKGNSFGYINEKGKLVVPAIYEYAYDFHNGFGQVTKNGKYGFVDTSGKLVVPMKYSNVSNFSEGLAWVYFKGAIGYVNTKGKEVIPFNYNYKTGGNFSSGLAWVEKDNECFYIDKNGKVVIPGPFTCASDFIGNLAWVSKEPDKSKGYIINKAGETVIDSDAGINMMQFDNQPTDYIGIYTKTKDDSDLYGIMDSSNGKIVVPLIYEEIGLFYDGLALVVKNGKSGYVNKEGKLVIPCIYDYGRDFTSNHRAVVMKNDKSGVIDNKGKVIVKINYDAIESYRDGLARVMNDYKIGYIDSTGKVIIPIKYYCFEPPL